MRGSSGFRLLIDIRCKLVKTVVVANYEVAAEIVAAKTGEGIQRQVEQVFSFPIHLFGHRVECQTMASSTEG